MSAIEISSDPARLDLEAVRAMLGKTYWAEGIPLEVVKKSCDNSICFGAYDGAKQVGIARVITDRATYAYLADVIVDEAYRGRGISKQIMTAIMQHPDLQSLRRFGLFTRDAHELYRKFGFKACEHPDWYLEICKLNPFAPKKS